MTQLPQPHRRWRRTLATLCVAAVLAAVFWAYLNPHTVVDLGGRLWSCFG